MICASTALCDVRAYTIKCNDCINEQVKCWKWNLELDDRSSSSLTLSNERRSLLQIDPFSVTSTRKLQEVLS